MSEKKLGISFRLSVKSFIKSMGICPFSVMKYMESDPEDDSGILEGNSVAYATE